MRLIDSLILTIVGAAVLAIPNMTRNNVMFGLLVEKSFRQGLTARKSVNSYRVLIAIVCLATLCALWLMPESYIESVVAAGPMLILMAGAGGFVWQRRNLKSYAVDPLVARQAGLTTAPERLPWFTWLSPFPFVILAGAADFLRLHWASIPVRFPVHWELNGQANRWSARTVHDVYGPIAFGMELCAFILIIGFATWYGARRSRFRRITLATTVACDYLVSLLIAATALAPLVRIPLWLVVLVPLALVVPTVILMARAISEPTNAIEATPNECWKAGMIYYNPNDTALFVEKRFGLGYTFNFANRWSWILAVGLVLVLSTAPLLM